jgi:DNA-binding MarR family transcriptional regulator
MEERFQTFTGLITDINRCIHKIKTVEMAEYDLKSSHVSCLYYLYKMVSLTARELCDLCREDKANISRSIKHLETEGFIVCHSRPAKRYPSPLELTEKGREVGQRITEKIDAVLERAGEGMSEEERTVMYRGLSRVAANLHRICGGYEARAEEESI